MGSLSEHQKYALRCLSQNFSICEWALTNVATWWMAPTERPTFEDVHASVFAWLKKHDLIVPSVSDATKTIYTLSERGRDLAVRLGYMKPRPSTIEDYE